MFNKTSQVFETCEVCAVLIFNACIYKIPDNKYEHAICHWR